MLFQLFTTMPKPNVLQLTILTKNIIRIMRAMEKSYIAMAAFHMINILITPHLD